MRCSRSTCVFALVLWAGSAVQAQAGELLVTSFNSDQVGRHAMPGGAFLGLLDTSAGLDGPLCARLGPDGKLYVTSEATNSVARFDPSTGAFLGNFITPGAGGLNGPTGITWGADGNAYVSSFNGDSVLKYDGISGSFLGTFIPTASGGLNGPDNGTIFGPDGNLYVPSYFSNRVMKFDGVTGALISTISVLRPRVIEFRGPHFYVTSESVDSVRRYVTATGAFVDSFVTSGSGGLDVPIGMAFGGDGFLYVTSATKNQVLRYNADTGAFVDVFIGAGVGGIDAPAFLTVIPSPSGAALLMLAGLASRRRR